jgi:hypothetical protein
MEATSSRPSITRAMNVSIGIVAACVQQCARSARVLRSRYCLSPLFRLKIVCCTARVGVVVAALKMLCCCVCTAWSNELEGAQRLTLLWGPGNAFFTA